nr:MAG TPA: hypothetical protein [Caudoviricetes sp.]
MKRKNPQTVIVRFINLFEIKVPSSRCNVGERVQKL